MPGWFVALVVVGSLPLIPWAKLEAYEPPAP